MPESNIDLQRALRVNAGVEQANPAVTAHQQDLQVFADLIRLRIDVDLGRLARAVAGVRHAQAMQIWLRQAARVGFIRAGLERRLLRHADTGQHVVAWTARLRFLDYRGIWLRHRLYLGRSRAALAGARRRQ
jgi:hypothetical protein